MKKEIILLEELSRALREDVADNFCGSIKDPSFLKIQAAKLALPQASWLLDNFRLFVELLCIQSSKENAIANIVKKLIDNAGDSKEVVSHITNGFDLFFNQYDLIQSLPVGMDSFKAIIAAMEQEKRFNERKVIIIARTLVEEGVAGADDIKKLVNILIRLKSKINISIDKASLMKSVQSILPPAVVSLHEYKIRAMIRNVLLEATSIYSYPGDTAYEYQKKGKQWYARKSGSADNFTIKIKDAGTIEKLNKKAKKKSTETELKPDDKKDIEYGINEYVKVGSNEYLVLSDGIVWQTAGKNEKAPDGNADRSEVIEIGHINDVSLKQIKNELISAGFKEPKKYKKVEKDNINPLKRWMSMAFTSPIPVFARAFAAYLTNRKKVWTERELKLDEYDALKKLIIYALTPQGRYIAKNAARLGVDNRGGLLSYGIYRLANDIHGFDSTGVFTGDSSKGFDAGSSHGPFNSISKFVGGMNPEYRGKIKVYEEKVKNNEGFVMVLNDIYDFDEYESKRKIFEKNPDAFETIYEPSLKKMKKAGGLFGGGAYEGIRYAAGFKMAVKNKDGKYYEGFPIKLTVKITPGDIEKAKLALDNHLGSVADPEYYKDKSKLGLVQNERESKEQEEKEAQKEKRIGSKNRPENKELPQAKKLSWIDVLKVTPEYIEGIPSVGKNSGKKVKYKAGTLPYKYTIKDLRK